MVLVNFLFSEMLVLKVVEFSVKVIGVVVWLVLRWLSILVMVVLLVLCSNSRNLLLFSCIIVLCLCRWCCRKCVMFISILLLCWWL